jgi:hypothetical protein
VTHAPSTWPSLVKEARALVPTFVAIAAAVVAASLLDVRGAALIMMGFAWGVIMLGAQSIGHEYSNRTLSLLLAQPCSRSVILARKAIVLIPLVVALTLIAAVCLPGEGLQPLRQSGLPQTMLVLAAICAVSLAPLFSMLGRGTLPGTVFAIAIPGLVELIAEFSGTAIYGFNAAAPVFAFKLSFVRSSMFCICAAAAIGAWWQFSRLQAVEGHQPLELPSLLGRGRTAAGEVSRQNPFVALIRKELHLQQISFVVVSLYVLAWLALWVVEHQAPETPRVPLGPLTMMYLALLSMLIGSVASAEERQLGTLPSQLLLPIAAWKQWAIKAATAIALALLLATALPQLLYAVLPLPDDKLPARLLRELPLAVVLLTALSLYVSSLCGTAVRAMVASIPVAVCAGIYSRFVANVVLNVVVGAVFIEAGRPLSRWQIERIQAASQYAMLFAATAAVILLLRFAFVNHRSGEQRIGVTVAQAAILIAVTTIFLAAPVLLSR